MKFLDPFIAVLIFHAVSLPNDLPSVRSTPLKAEQEVINSLIQQQFFRFSTHVIGNDYSVGVLFRPERPGVLSKLHALVPQEGNYKISLWDVESQELLVQATVDQTIDEWSVVEIPDQWLKANHTYAISIFLPIGTHYYNVSELELPATVEDIHIISSVAAYSDTYPVDLKMPDALFGLLDFTFAATSEKPISSVF